MDVLWRFGSRLFKRCGLAWKYVILVVGASTIPVGAEEVDFVRDVQPIFAQHCVRCHRTGFAQGDLRLDVATDIVEAQYVLAGSPEDSELLHIVRGVAGERPRMPKEGDPLSSTQVMTLERWIRQGATWPSDVMISEDSRSTGDWWSLQPVTAGLPPANPHAPDHWQQHAIDRFVYARLVEHGLEPGEMASRAQLIRRVTFDLIGLPPTPAEIERFVNDSAPDAYERLVDRLLASPAYGERWGRHWLDVVRFGESRGFERNEIINNLWPFRDYVIQAFNSDKPYDRLVREHLAGDVIGKDHPDIEVATAFLVCGPYDDVGNQDPVQAAQIRANTIDEMIRTTSEAFLGMTVGCARCHHHKFDPIRQQDYYGLYATFAGVHHGVRSIATTAERDAYDRALAPLEADKAEIHRQLTVLREEIDAQAEAIASSIDARGSRPPANRQATREEFEPLEALFVQLSVAGSEADPAVAHGYTIDEFEVWSASQPPENVALSSGGATARGASRVADDFADAYSPSLTIDGRYGARWIASGPSLTIKLAKPTRIAAVVFSSDRKGDAGDHGVANFVADYEIRISTDGEHWRTVADSSDRAPINVAHRQHRYREAATTDAQRRRQNELRVRAAAIDTQIQGLRRPEVWWVGEFRDAPGPFHVFLGGDPQRPGPETRPSGLAALQEIVSYPAAAETAESVRRRQLAEWIVHPDHPLTPRVLVNRLWHYHFGRGLVSTPSDFGAMGQLPTHPLLLDYLAQQLLTHQWHMKPLQRQIVLSQTYRQATTYRAQAAEADADARWLWRFPPRRLDAEQIRDAMLSVAGLLDREMYGPGFRLYQYLQDNVATYVPLDDHGPETYRRAVYHQNARAMRVDVLTDFDCPDNAFSAPARATTTSPLQALVMLNHQFPLDVAEAFAVRLRSTSAAAAEQIQLAFQLAFARPANASEQQAATELIERYGLRAFCRGLLNSNEFVYLD